MFSLQMEENTLMKEALGKMKNSKEKNMCWQDGRLFEDKEDWIVDSCTKCTCQVASGQMCRFSVNIDDRANISSRQESKIVCHQITCPPVACASPSFLDGECCPVCLREYFGLFLSSRWCQLLFMRKSWFWTCVSSLLPAVDSDDGWSPWSEWTECTVTCGTGTQQRGRSCDATSNPCTGPSIQTRKCSLVKCDKRGKGFFSFISFPVFQFPAAVTTQLSYYLEQRRPLS